MDMYVEGYMIDVLMMDIWMIDAYIEMDIYMMEVGWIQIRYRLGSIDR